MIQFIYLLLIMIQQDAIIFDFNKGVDVTNWVVVDDVVMGGVSQGNFELDKDGNGIFYGEVSLENNGGFSSVRHQFKQKNVSKYSKVVIRLKGDGKTYQFRVKDNLRNYHSYISNFKTTSDWQEIHVNLSEMYPAFRGRKLRMKNFSAEYIEEIRFLIANKKNEPFRLEIDKIYFK